MLAIFPPMALVLILISWVILEAAGYGLIIHALHGDFQPRPPGIIGSTYISAASLFGVGQSTFLPTGRAARVVIPIVNATGLATVALVITFLFSLYANFQKREAQVVTLDARAGAPPSGVTLLETYAQLEMLGRLPDTFAKWETWSAEVLDSHLSYPLLAFFRSTHDNQSWISALGAVLDAAALVLTTIDDGPRGSAYLLQAVGTHLVGDLGQYFRLDGAGDPYVEEDEFKMAHERLLAAGYHLREASQAWAAFAHLRSEYAGILNAMARQWATPPALWIGDRSRLRPHAPRVGGK
jgi:hypothetical protein